MHLTEASFYYGEFEYMLSKVVDWSGDWATPWGSANRGTKAKTITSCDNAFVTNIGAAAASLSRKKHLLARDPAAKRSVSSKAPRKLCSVRKRSANVAAANVLTVRKRSDSNNKAPSWNGNQPHAMVMIGNFNYFTVFFKLRL